jgi:hypothetical protein
MEYERYISDGLIEKHFLGFTTQEEEEDLRIHLNIFPELQTEMEEVERRMERAAFKDAPMPPAHIKTALMQRIALEEVTRQATISSRQQHNIYTEVAPPEDKINVHIGWKIFLIFFLSSIALSVIAILLYYRQVGW